VIREKWEFVAWRIILDDYPGGLCRRNRVFFSGIAISSVCDVTDFSLHEITFVANFICTVGSCAGGGI
jgi:hypothetical protein